jgi:hypothetical protein
VPRDGQVRPSGNSDGYDRRAPRPDDFAGRPRPSGVNRDRQPGDQFSWDGFRSGGPARWLGRMPTWTATLVLFGWAALGIIVTLVAGQEPGALLGFFIIVGTIAAALFIRRGKVYLLFPAPALAFFVAAIVTGKVHDAKLGSSTAGLASGFTQWVAGIFFPAVVATILVLLIGGGRWLLGRQLVIGAAPLSAGRPAPGKPRPAPRDRRPGVDSWADEAPLDNSSSRTGPTPGQGNAPRPGGAAQNGNRPPRPPRDPRANRDPWGDPRLPADRPQAAANKPRPPADRTQPPANKPRPQADRTQPPANNPRPRPGGQPRAPRPSFNPNQNPASPRPPRPARPPRRQPPEGWT